MKRFLLAWWLLSFTAAYSGWLPPENPQPTVILKEAKEDAKNMHYEDALAKHVWYFDNALAIDQSLCGVRLSFALHDWYELALKYPPAMEALHGIRDQTEDDIRAAKPPETPTFETLQSGFQQFNDFVSLNQRLLQNERTVTLFKWLDEHQPDRARMVFAVSERSLIEAKEYKLCSKYLDPERDFAQFARVFTMQREMGKQPRMASLVEFGEKAFTSQTATLIALLVLNDRADEAKTVRDRATGLWDARTFHEQLDEALTGKLPPPFPESLD